MATRRIISGSRPVLLLMRRVWFNCNRVFSRFEFIFSNSRRIQDGFRTGSGIVTPAQPGLYFKNNFFLFYFIL